MSARAGDDPDAVRGPAYPIESVDNVLRLIVLLTERKQVRVSEVSSELGVAVSTAHRLLAMLVHHGFASQNSESKVYSVGSVLLRAGLLAARDLDVRTLVQPFLDQLRDQTGETAHAAVLQGDEMLFVACAESPNAFRVASRVGTLIWAHCTSIGKAWLACESDEFLNGLYTSPRLPALTERSVTSRVAFMNEIGAVRRAGFARNEGESETGVGSVSIAVCRRDGRPVVSLSVSVPLVRMYERRWNEFVATLRKTKAAAEAALT